jgi:c(7)-type cytochrome triheme protein
MKFIATLSLSLVLSATAALAADKTPPEKLVFESKLGNVTFDHAKHVEHEKNKCETCHDGLFPQSREPINFGKGMHKPAEKSKAACAACHHEGGAAFASKGKCKTCHVK